MAQQNVVNPVFKKILLAETERKHVKSFNDKLDEIDKRFYLLLPDFKKCVCETLMAPYCYIVFLLEIRL